MRNQVDFKDKHHFLVLASQNTDKKNLLDIDSVENLLVLSGYNKESFADNLISADVLSEKAIRAYWVQDILSSLKQFKISSVYDSIQDVDVSIPSLISNPQIWSNALDNADEIFEQAGQKVCFLYDFLTCRSNNVDNFVRMLNSLLSFWLTQSHRWTQMYCKIILKEEDFDPQMLSFQDGVKVRSHLIHI